MIRLAQIGIGYWGKNLLRNFMAMNGAQVVAVCDRDPSVLEKIAVQYPLLQFSEKAPDVCSDANIDAVAVVTPVESHFELAKAALDAGKHVFVEKPMARTSAECRELIDLAAKHERVLMVGHTFLYNAAVLKVREFIQSGELGEIYYLYSQRLNLGRVRKDVDAMWNFAPHDLSIMLHWLQRQPLRVAARGSAYLQKDVADVVFLQLDFDGGVTANIHVSWLDPNKVRRMTVVGSKKMVVYDDVTSDHKVQVFDKGIARENISANFGEFDSFGKFQLIQRAGDVLMPKVDFVEPLKVQCQHFVDCIVKNQKPLSDGENGLQVVRILEAAQRSMEARGGMVEVKD
jgi:predicted dehydrogenase